MTNPAKWRILGTRVDAWCTALVELELAHLERGADVRWRGDGLPWPTIARVVPRAAGAIPLVMARGPIEGVEDAVIGIALGDPATVVIVIPDCGCDACDSGSQNELDHLDTQLRSIVTGRLRRLSCEDVEITVLGDDDGWRASSSGGRLPDVPAVLADPSGWHEVSGASWL